MKRKAPFDCRILASLHEAKSGSLKLNFLKNLRSRGPKMELPAWLPMDAWEGFCEMRIKLEKKKKIPWTNRAMVVAINKLERLRDEGYDPKEVLDESTLRGWAGVFPTNDKMPQPQKAHEVSEHGRQIGLKLQKLYMDRAAAKAAEKVRSIA